MTGLRRLLLAFGLTLIAGGLGHLFGVGRLYWAEGAPDMSRILIDLWVGQAQIAGGSFYIAAAGAARRGERWQTLAIAGAVIILGWTSLAVPVLFARAPLTFRIPATTYLIVSASLLVAAHRSRRVPAAAHR